MKHFIAAAGFAALIASTATAQDAPKTGSTPAPIKQDQVSRLSGKLLGLDGTTGWAGRLIKVTPVGKTATFGVMTDRNGGFVLPQLQPGTYVIQVGKLARTLKVIEGQTNQPLVLLASRDVLESEAVPMGQAVVVGGTSIAPWVVGGILAGLTIGGVTYTLREIGRSQRLSRHRDNYYERLRQSPSTP